MFIFIELLVNVRLMIAPCHNLCHQLNADNRAEMMAQGQKKCQNE
tara:strand:+ start:877 stop:1011 length:135 start_codon:yes stop_codon:yes gene_type:complete